MRDLLTNLDLLGGARQATCEFCHADCALFRYNLFSAQGSSTGISCLSCLPNVLRAVKRCDSGGPDSTSNMEFLRTPR